MKIKIINGPNLNLLGTREPEVYGSTSFVDYFKQLKAAFPKIEFDYFQSNVEGELINALHEANTKGQHVVLNGAGFTHTSIALADAVAAIQVTVVEVHISNIYAREEIRHTSLTGKNCLGVITGFGLNGYNLAVEALLAQNS
jgi:3-dehydroquinate dehydratase-2